MAVTFHRLAAREFAAARRWYARYSPQAEARFTAAVDAAVRLIDANPSVGATFQARFRWIRVRRYPYLLYYRDTGTGSVMVYAVAHARRRPGYWLGRPNRP